MQVHSLSPKVSEKMSVLSQSFSVVSGQVIHKLLENSHEDVTSVVRDTYLLHHIGATHNPDSYFLRFADKPEARIIALPAAIRSAVPLAGLKWISSYPNNTTANLQRASAALLLNDYETGYPIACLEASQISSSRTAASAVLAAEVLGERGRTAAKMAFIGGGVIARTILEFFHAMSWEIEECAMFDLRPHDADKLASLAGSLLDIRAVVAPSLEDAVKGASHVVFATTAPTPYVFDTTLFHAGQIVLNISLRDLSPEIILGATNIFDDVEHCLKAGTSPHLAEQQSGNRDFVGGTLAGVMASEQVPDRSKPIVFSPFGLGVLDVALGKYLLDLAKSQGLASEIKGFFPATARW